MMSKYIPMPRDLWRNECPIILVHGYAGQTTDKNFLFRGYFHHCFDPEIMGEHAIFESDVQPFGSLHDRACELYQ
jgi:hypothetical protein